MEISPSRKRIAVIVAVLTICLAVGIGVYRHYLAGRPAPLYGNIDIREVTLGFRVAGRVAKLAVDEGDPVREGQELARLDTQPLEIERDEARASAAALAARLELLKAGFRSEDVEQARATLDERRASAANAEQLLARQEQLKGTGAVAQRSYDDALAARDQARARLAAAMKAYEELQRGYRHQEVAEGAANYDRAVAQLAAAEQRLTDAALLAPADGIVLTRAAESGAILAAGTPVFTLSLVKPVWARIYVSEPDLGRFNPSKEVLLYTDARPGRPYHGRVGFVSPTAEFTPKNVETPELRTALVYRARVVVSDPDEALRQGMPVTVTVE